MKVLISGAGGRIAYSLIPLMGKGRAFGKSQKLDLILYDVPHKENYLKGLKLEIEDSIFECIRDIRVCTSPADAFKDVDVITYLAGIPLPKKSSRLDYLAKNREIYAEQAIYMDTYAKKDVKVTLYQSEVLVVANPANTISLILAEMAKSIPPQNITCLMRLDQNRTKWMISQRFSEEPHNITNVVVWGNHSSTQYPCIDFMKIKDKKEFKPSHQDLDWAKETLVPEVRSRAFQVGSLLGYPSVFSPAKAACDHLKDWFCGTDPVRPYFNKDTFITMGVVSDGSYDVPKGLVFGMPVRCKKNFQYDVVKDLNINDEMRQYINESADECLSEKRMAL